jgi:site-specific DNA-methyltransferase (adenine-specific)
MKPYYQDDWATIYHGDCREILPTLDKVDALVTDPPWGLGELSGTTSKARARNSYASHDDTEEFVVDVVVPSVVVALGLCKGRGLVASGCRCMWLYPRPRAVGGFYQPAAVGMSPWGFAGYNPVLFYGKDPRDGKGQSSVMTSLTQRASTTEHPCAKPEKAMLWMANKASVEGETILDPFMGSGTTLRAAKDLNRHSIGIEIEEKYCEIAAKRLQQEVFDFSGAVG